MNWVRCPGKPSPREEPTGPNSNARGYRMREQQQPGELSSRRLLGQTGPRARLNEHDLVMSERDHFLTWVNTSLYAPNVRCITATQDLGGRCGREGSP